jgi:hypothetical protein
LLTTRKIGQNTPDKVNTGKAMWKNISYKWALNS